MERCEDEVRGERTMYRNLKLEVVISFKLLRVTDMLFHGLEPALNVLVLGLVKGLQAAGFASSSVCSNRTKAVAFSGVVSTEEVQLRCRFQAQGKLVRVVGGCVDRGGRDVFDIGRRARALSGMTGNRIIVIRWCYGLV